MRNIWINYKKKKFLKKVERIVALDSSRFAIANSDGIYFSFKNRERLIIHWWLYILTHHILAQYLDCTIPSRQFAKFRHAVADHMSLPLLDPERAIVATQSFLLTKLRYIYEIDPGKFGSDYGKITSELKLICKDFDLLKVFSEMSHLALKGAVDAIDYLALVYVKTLLSHQGYSEDKVIKFAANFASDPITCYCFSSVTSNLMIDTCGIIEKEILRNC